jgi:acetyl esterase/lipase
MLTLHLRDAGLRLPAAVWCSSPWVDLELGGDSMAEKDDVDPLIRKDYLDELAGLYCGDGNRRDPRVSPLHADLHGLPELLIQVGSEETLLDDAVRVARRAGSAGVRVRLEIWPDMIHAWMLFHPELAEGREALATAGLFMRGVFDRGKAF